MERIIKAKEILVRGWRTGGYSGDRMGQRMVGLPRGCVVGLQATFWLTVSVLLISCTTLKKAAIVSSLGTTGALVGNAVSGTAGLVVGGLTTAAVADVATEVMVGSTSSSDMSNCAPDNFWSLLGSLIELGGWALILIVIVPMVFSWLMPGPIQFKGRKNK